MLPSAGSSSRAEEAAILEEAKAVSSVRGAAAGGGGRGDGAAAGGRGGRGRGNSGRARDALPESPTLDVEDEQPAEGGMPCICVRSLWAATLPPYESGHINQWSSVSTVYAVVPRDALYLQT